MEGPRSSRAGRVGRRRWQPIPREILAVAILLTASAFVVAPAGGFPRPAGAFAFPVSYGTPTLPVGVGARAPIGLTVPSSQVGLTVPVASLGPSGHPGPVNASSPLGITTGSAATLSVRVFNGSVGSSAPASGQTVTVQNATLGSVKTAVCTTKGYANFTATDGWYLVKTRSSAYATNLNYTALVQLIGATPAVTAYQVPATLGNPAVNNGGASRSQVWVHFGLGTATAAMWPIAAQLVNKSAGSTVIATTIVQNNLTVGFSGVNDAFSYAVQLVGFKNNYTGTWYGFNAAVSATFSPTGATYVVTPAATVGQWATDSSTGALVGTALPTSATAGPWNLLASTTITGGVTSIGTGISASSGALTLQFVNAIVLVNLTYPGPNYAPGAFPNLQCINSTIVDLAPLQAWRAANHCTVVGGLYRTTAAFQLTPPTFLNSSYLDYFLGAHGPQAGAWSNSYILNVSGSQAPFSGIDFAFPPSMVHDGISNATADIDVSSFNASYSTFDNSSVILGLTSGGGNDHLTGLSLWNDYFGPNLTTVSRPGNVFRGNIWHDLFAQSEPWNATRPTQPQPIAFPSASNVSYDVFTYAGNGHLQAGTYYGDSNASFYDDIANDFVDRSGFWGDNLSVVVTGPGGILRDTLFNCSQASFDGFGWTISHNEFVNMLGITTTVGALPTPNGATQGTFSDNRFDALIWNQSWFHVQTGGNAGGSTAFATEEWDQYVLVTHDTFNEFVAGGGPGGPATDLVGPQMNVTYCVFANSEIYPGTLRFALANDSYDIGVYDQRVISSSQQFPFQVAHNWFLNLSNATQPFYIASANANPRVVLNDNHYWYAPYPGAGAVPLWAQFAEIAGTISSDTDAAYVYNTSTGGGPPWVWRILPDVNGSSGLVSYGGVAGPQPNFVWNGYTYTESVEPNLVQVGSLSATAFPILAGFPLSVPGASYAVHVFNATTGAAFLSVNETAAGNGVVAGPFDPRADPNPAVYNASCNVPCQPAAAPSAGVFGGAFLGIPLIVWVGGGGLVVVLAISVAVRKRAP